jgi:hypothetical protein
VRDTDLLASNTLGITERDAPYAAERDLYWN